MARIDAGLAAGDPDGEVTLVWRCYQRLRSIYHAPTPEQGRRIAEQVIATFATCPVPEIARLGRTLRAWRTPDPGLLHHQRRLQRRHRSHQTA